MNRLLLIWFLSMMTGCSVIEYTLPTWDGSMKNYSVKVSKDPDVYKVYLKYLDIWGKDPDLSFETGYSVLNGDTIYLEICDSIPLTPDFKLLIDCYEYYDY